MSKNREEKGESKILTVFLIILIIALIGALLYILNAFGIKLPFIQNINESEFQKALTENNYQAAYTVYKDSEEQTAEIEYLKKHLDEYFQKCFLEEYTNDTWTLFRGIEIFNVHIEEAVLAKMDETVTAYYNNEFSEDNAKKYLSRLAKFSFAKEKYTLCLEQVKNKDASHKAYNDGVSLFNEGKFQEAVQEFKKVSPQDEQRYPLALDAIGRCKNEWGSVKLAEAQAMIDAYNKEGAQALLEELMGIFGEYEEAEQMILLLQPELEG